MKNSDCSTFLEEVMSSGKLSPEAAAHLETCRECAMLRKSLLDLPAGCSEAEVPQYLDRAIFREAESCCRKRALARLVFRRILPAVSAAAAAAVICVIALTPEVPETRQVTLAEAAIPADWSTIESNAFDLNQELTSCQHNLANWQGTYGEML